MNWRLPKIQQRANILLELRRLAGVYSAPDMTKFLSLILNEVAQLIESSEAKTQGASKPGEQRNDRNIAEGHLVEFPIHLYYTDEEAAALRHDRAGVSVAIFL